MIGKLFDYPDFVIAFPKVIKWEVLSPSNVLRDYVISQHFYNTIIYNFR